MPGSRGPSPGAVRTGEGTTRFRLWAPVHDRIELHILAPFERFVPMDPLPDGYHQAELDVPAGTRYLFRLPDRSERPDPASRYQPEGVHAPSAVVDGDFQWHDARWTGIALEESIYYEIHVGTFTHAGTFRAIISHLDDLHDLGVTAIELMPVAQFPGERNWGYDGAYPFAVQNSYGGPLQLKELVDACHDRGMAVILDVVYNHLGPEGNYLAQFAPYFTDRYRTPWGHAINFDGPESDGVRNFFIENALYWITDLHLDGLRLDAVHAIADMSAYPFLRELGDAVHERAASLGRTVQLIAESDLNDPKLVRPSVVGGFGLDAQWSDDFHHALHAVLTDEQSGYYEDFGSLRDLVEACRDTFVRANRYSQHRRRRHGAPAGDLAMSRFVVFSQNHDQVGNRMLGERLSTLVNFEQLKLAAGAVLLSPYLPLLFMGEEYGETNPFLYFTSHSDAELIRNVREGRRQEFAAFRWTGEPPDPQSPETFVRSRPNREQTRTAGGMALRSFYRELIRLRSHPAMKSFQRKDTEVACDENAETITMLRSGDGHEAVVVLNFGGRADAQLPAGTWSKLLASSEKQWGGNSAPLPELVNTPLLTLDKQSLVVYERRT